MAVVTDSTVDLALAFAEEIGLRVVPMTVAFGDRSFVSRVQISDEAFYERLASSDALPSTSQPAPGWFEEAYADAADDGADAVVSIHVSGALSGTVDTARQVAADAPLPVHVVDSRQVSGALALPVLAAVRAAAAGADAADVVDVAAEVSRRSRIFFTVDTLEYLRKGGRLSGTQAAVGSVLRVKPILTIDGGEVRVVERTRTWGRALERLVDLCHGHVGDAPTDAVVTHGLAGRRAEQLAGFLDARLDVRRRVEAVIGPVVGTHCGPGAVGVAVAAR